MDFITLLGLALVDSLSAGTLIIPIVLLLLWQRMRLPHFITYLGTIVGAYFAIGVAGILALEHVRASVDTLTSSHWLRWALFLLGIALLAFGILAPTPKKKPPEEVIARRSKGIGVETSSPLSMVVLALGAAVIEVATMLPYLAALGIIRTLELNLPGQLLILGVYCLVMILPATVIGCLYKAFGERISPKLTRSMASLEYETAITLLWIAVIVGINLVFRNGKHLGLFG